MSNLENGDDRRGDYADVPVSDNEGTAKPDGGGDGGISSKVGFENTFNSEGKPNEGIGSMVGFGDMFETDNKGKGTTETSSVGGVEQKTDSPQSSKRCCRTRTLPYPP